MQRWLLKPQLHNQPVYTVLRTEQVRLVHDLRLDDFLDDVLQRDDADHLVEGVALALAVHPLHHGQVGFTCKAEGGEFKCFQNARPLLITGAETQRQRQRINTK